MAELALNFQRKVVLMTDENVLLPCFRCGGRSVSSDSWEVGKESSLCDDDFCGTVSCSDCDLTMYRHSYANAGAAERFAISAWNARTPEEIESTRQS